MMLDWDISAPPETCHRLLAEQLVALCEEHLMAVYYKDVPKEWLCLLTLAFYLQSIVLLRLTKWQDAIHALDRAIIIAGAPVLETDIHEFIAHICATHVPHVYNNDKDEREVKRLRASTPAIRFPIDRYQHDQLSLTAYRQLLRQSRPFIIEGAINDWPCLNERPWSDLHYLQQLIGRHRLVPVELGKSYTAAGWSQQLMPFGEFFDRYIVMQSTTDAIGYLAQHNLLRQIPAMKRDVFTPEYCYITDDDNSSTGTTEPHPPEPIIHTWFGPAGTQSPLHTDPYRNLFAQIVGQKYIRLYSPAETDRVYPRQGTIISNTSQVEDIETPDYQRFPLLRHAEYVETVVRPGDLLMIPRGWWHYVRSLSVSFSISYWW
jgi:lysine-specific demethylase 8